MDMAFTHFFKGHTSFPTFKNKKSAQTFRNPHGKWVIIKDGKLSQPKFKEGIKIIIDRELKGKIINTAKSSSGTIFSIASLVLAFFNVTSN